MRSKRWLSGNGSHVLYAIGWDHFVSWWAGVPEIFDPSLRTLVSSDQRGDSTPSAWAACLGGGARPAIPHSGTRCLLKGGADMLGRGGSSTPAERDRDVGVGRGGVPGSCPHVKRKVALDVWKSDSYDPLAGNSTKEEWKIMAREAKGRRS